MTPSIGSYIGGSLSLVVIVVALGFGAFHLRSWIVPRYTGALARLAELVLAAAAFVLILQVLGSFGLLRAGWIPAACAIAGVGSGLLARAKARASRSRGADQRPAHHPGRAADRGRSRVLDRGGMEPADASLPRPRHVRRRQRLVPHADLGPVRAGGVDRLASLHRSAATGGLVLPAHLRALERRRDRDVRLRLPGIADEPRLARRWIPRSLVRRTPVRARTSDGRLRRAGLQLGVDVGDAGRGGAQRHDDPGAAPCPRRLSPERPRA